MHTSLLQSFYTGGFERVERDDRLLDVFTNETREKGVELWERSTEETVQIIRVRRPYAIATLSAYSLPRQRLEKLLLMSQTSSLEDFTLLAKGSDVVAWLA